MTSINELSIVILLFPVVYFLQVAVKHRFQSQESLEQTIHWQMYSATKATYLSITNATTEKAPSYRNVSYKTEPLTHQKVWFLTMFMLSRMSILLSHNQRLVYFDTSAA